MADSEDERLEHLKAAALDAIRTLELCEPEAKDETSRALMRESSRALKRALDRYITDTQPIELGVDD